MQNSHQTKQNQWIRYLLLLIGAVFFILPRVNTELDLIYILSPWIYLTCFIYFTRTMARKLDWLVFSLVLLTAHELRYESFLGDYEISFLWISIALNAVLTGFNLIPYLLDRYYLRKGKDYLSWIVFPAMRIMIEEFIIGHQFNLSLTQYGNKWLIQSVSIAGDIFVSFFVAFVPSLIVWIILNRDRKTARMAGVIALGACALVFVVGGIRYETSSPPDNGILMAYASGPAKTYYENPAEEDPDYAENAAYLEKTVAEAASGGAKLMAYAEEAFEVEGEEEANLIALAQEKAKENGIFVLLSLDVMTDDDRWENKIVFIDDQGAYLSDYRKSYLIPVIEDQEYTAGDGVIPADLVVIDGQERMVSYSICYDATFSEYLMQMNHKTDTFINPSWDWEEVVDLNYRMQGISAIQSGVVLFKPTVDGWSVVADPYGRILYKENTLRQDYNQIYYASVPSQRVKTFYPLVHKVVRAFWTFMALLILIVTAYLMIRQFAGWIQKKRRPVLRRDEDL
ncbi:MAG: hypothetical protein J6P72_07545 [Firmicutes bacterium]|nr:hypothetical protein [Bacillota bacterium]